MVRELLVKVASLRRAAAPSEDPPPGGGTSGAGDAAGTSRRNLITRGLGLFAGAVGVGISGTALQSAGRAGPVAVPAGAVPPVAIRPTELALFVRDVRFSSPGVKPGELPTGKVLTAPHGALVDASGTVLGSFSGGLLPGSSGQLGFQRFVFAGGTLIGMGSGSLVDEEYAVVGGTGRYAGASGTYSTKIQPGNHGRDAEFRFNVTGMRW